MLASIFFNKASTNWGVALGIAPYFYVSRVSPHDRMTPGPGVTIHDMRHFNPQIAGLGTKI
jgi:hypothetical protein